jgi:hypothetical protein
MSKIVSMFHHCWPQLKTLGELADVARATPQTKILDTAIKDIREIDRLHRSGIKDGAMLRQIIVAGVLINRAIFETYGIPQDLSHPIGQAEPRSAS